MARKTIYSSLGEEAEGEGATIERGGGPHGTVYSSAQNDERERTLYSQIYSPPPPPYIYI